MAAASRPRRWCKATSYMLVLLLISSNLYPSHARATGKNYLYNEMPPGDATPIIEYISPKDNYTKNNQGGSALEYPDFLYSTTGPAAVARVVEFYAYDDE